MKPTTVTCALACVAVALAPVASALPEGSPSPPAKNYVGINTVVEDFIHVFR